MIQFKENPQDCQIDNQCEESTSLSLSMRKRRDKNTKVNLFQWPIPPEHWKNMLFVLQLSGKYGRLTPVHEMPASICEVIT